MEALVAFLPRLFGDDAPPLVYWKDAEKNEYGRRVYSGPEYDESVKEFMNLVVEQNCWMVRKCDLETAGDRLGNEAAVRNATIPEIQEMLTFVVKGEHFCDGAWAGMIESGRIQLLLERLSVILQERSTGDSVLRER